MKSIDFSYRNAGPVVFLFAETDEAQKWIVENITSTPWQNRDRVELGRRYFDEIGDAIKFDGLRIECSGETPADISRR